MEAAPTATIEGVSDGALRAQIEVAVGDSKTLPESAPAARRRATTAAKDAAALLRSEGYYEAIVQPEVDTSAGPRAVLEVTPGTRFRLAAPTIDWAAPAPNSAAQTVALKALGLAAGAPGRAAAIVAAEGTAIASLKKLGYADAAIQPREVIVDFADYTVRPTFHIASGERVRLGRVRVVSKGRTRPQWVAGMAPWKPGALYDPALLALLEKSLLETGAYETVSVDLAPASERNGDLRTVRVVLVDRKPHSLELGAGYSTTEGSGVEGKWINYNRLRRGDTLTLTAKLYDIQQKLDLEEDLPNWLKRDQILKVGGGFLGDRTPAYDDVGGGVRASVTRNFDKGTSFSYNFAKSTSFSYGLALDYASTEQKEAVNQAGTPVGQQLNLFIATTTLAGTLDRSNSILDPTRGWRVEAEVDPTGILGDRNLAYVKAETQITGYWSPGAGWPVLAARAKVGSILGGQIPDVPADRRFYSGGGGSVRGFGYQQVGPQLSDGTPEGGLSLTEASFEIRQSLWKRWGVVLFADAGAVGLSEAPTLQNIGLGVGAGIRYDLGFGPLRLDLATPVNPRPGDSPVQVYISIGQAF